MIRPIITLTTDFGHSSPYVAEMKGVILGINPEVTLVDLTHEIPPQNIRQAALALSDVIPHFPSGTIHVAVIDPGVGTSRRIVLVEMAGQRFIAPDNGLLSLVAQANEPVRVIDLTNSHYWHHPVSNTFHGRDIMAPAAAHLTLGIPADDFGKTISQIVDLSWPVAEVRDQQIQGTVISVDSFGNLITNIDQACLQRLGDVASVNIECAGNKISGIARTYGDQLIGSLLALIGSSERLEIAVSGGSAAETLGAGVDTEVVVIG